ncbi:MAG TPA: hypothetical protein VKZ50_08360 [bacterium]|nr:hypothetical protein [bacterium]
MPRYKVMVDDNFRYEDPEERWEHGVYDTAEDALAACRRIVDQSLQASYRPGMSAQALYDHYTSFGDDPFVVIVDGVDDSFKFSAWSYAQERCRSICGPDPAT